MTGMSLRHRPFWSRLPVAWLQLAHQKVRLAAAVLGVTFATLLMFAQLGLKESLLDSVAGIEARLQGDLFLVDQRSQALIASQPFSRRLLVLARSFPEVAGVTEMMAALGQLKHPVTGSRRAVLAIGVDPDIPALDLPEIPANREALRASDTLLFDEGNSEFFGPVQELHRQDARFRLQLEQQRLRVAGLFRLGASFAADGNVLLGKQAFQRVFADRATGGVDIGVVRLHPGASPAAVQAGLRRLLPASLRVMTRQELIDWEQAYWGSNTSIGFIFNQGVVIGFIVGVVIVYQILFTDIANHLSEYATLKAIGYGDRYLAGVVFQEALILSSLGYVPGLAGATALYRLTERATAIPMAQTWERALSVFALTLIMCFLSGLLAVRKLRQAAPAEVF